jgi:hypothetical protein
MALRRFVPLGSFQADCEKAGKKWRFVYHKWLKKLVYASCESPDEAIAIATAGLDYM